MLYRRATIDKERTRMESWIMLTLLSAFASTVFALSIFI